MQGVKFNLIDEKGNILETIETDENGIAETKRYPIRDFENLTLQEIETLENYELNEEPRKIVLEEGKVNVIFENNPKKGNIKIIKLDEYNNEIAIQGARFDLYEDTDRDGKITDADKFLETIETDENGVATSKKYRIDRQYLGVESYVPENYILDKTPFDFKLEWNKTIEKVIENKPKTIQIRIIKQDEEDKTPIKDVTFEIYEDSNKNGIIDSGEKLIDTITTNEEGIAISKDSNFEDKSKILRCDTQYILKETNHPDTYLDLEELILDFTDYIDEYTENLVKDITIYNVPKKGNIKIIKIDEFNKEIVIQGTRFDLYEDTDRDGKITDADKFLETIETDENGEAISKNYRIDRDYLYVEKYVNEHYELDTNAYKFNLEWNNTIEIVATNKPKTIQIQVIKVDSKDNTIRVPNVEFKIYEDVNENGILDEEDCLIDTITTDENGIALSKANDYEDKSKILRVDKQYILVESKHNEKYLDDEIQEALDYTEYLTNGEYTEGLQVDLEIENTPIEVTPTPEKIDRDTGKPLQGAEFDIYEDTNENGIFDSDDKLVRHYITNSEGTAEIEPLRCNTYFWFETKSPEGYVLDENVYTFKVENQDQIIILKSEDKIIENDVDIFKKANNDSIKYGIQKDEGVPETYFALYTIDNEGNIIDFAKDKYGNYIGEKIIIEDKEYYAVMTDKTGNVQVTVPYGKYLFREIKSHDLFLNDSKDGIIDVLDDGKQVTIEFYDTAVNLELDISKTGINQAQPNDVIRYDFPDLINKSNVSLDDFTWEDHLPSRYTKIQSLYTGTWNEDLTYHIFYKTNINDYKEFGNGYSTLENHFIDFESLGLNNEDQEYITDFKIIFGTVKSGFTFIEEPFIFVTVDSDIKEDDEWTNKTRLSGNYTDINGNLTELTDEDEYTTITYKEELKIVTLPRTGLDLSTSTIIIRTMALFIVVISGIYIIKKKK